MSFTRKRIIISFLFVASLLLLSALSERRFETLEPLADVGFYFIGVMLVAAGMLGRVWCSIYISGYKKHSLVQVGPYSMCRHPLYFFSFLSGLGLGFATETITIPIVFALGFVLYYPRVVTHDEKKMRESFGAKFEDYHKSTPSFFPSLSLYKSPEFYEVDTKIILRRLFESFWFLWGLGFLEFLEGLQNAGILPTPFRLY